MKTSKHLIISFVLILIFGLYFSILSYENKKQSEHLNDWVSHSHQVIKGITNLNTLFTEFEAEDQSFVIANKKDITEVAKERKVKASFQFNKLKSLTADNEVQQKNLEALNTIINAKVQYVNHVFDVLQKSQPEALFLLSRPESKRLYAQLKGILRSMLQVENELLNQRTVRDQEVSDKRFIYSSAFEILVLILLLIALYKIYRESINRKIAEEEAHKSEVKYKGLIEKSSLIIFTTDLHGHFTYMSDKGLEFTGYKMEELIGKHFNILLADNHKNEIAKFYLSQYKNFIKDLVEEFEIKTKDNKIKVIQLSTVLIEENNKIVGFQSIAKDITEVKYVEGLIKESRIRLQQQQEEYNLRMQSVLDNIPMILYIKDLEGKYLMINKNFTEIFGISSEAIVGKKNNDIDLLKKRAEFFETIDLRVKNTGKPIEFEEVMVTGQGRKNFLVTKFPLFDKNNNIFAISSVAKDISDLTYQRQQLIDARLKAEKAEQLQESFLANMSHEIRTPMNGIMGMTNMLLDTELDIEQKEYAELIKKSSDALLILINDILDLSKIKAGRMELEAIDFNIREAVQNVLQPMKMSLRKNVVLNYSINDAVPECINGDSHKLFQILNNLLSNAVKFTEKGEIKVYINVIEKNDEKIYIAFDVSDTGIGISSEHINNIFESFTQAGNDTVRRFGGTGLGLAIIKRLIELQNGTIYVQSVPGAGTTFHVQIPYLPATTKQAPLRNDNNNDINIYRDGIENKKILIVEDNVVNQRVLTSVLQKMKAQWEIANNGKEAVDALESGKHFDLIIMDLQMPVMNGFQATEHIRKQLKIDTPIIAMTASTLRNERVKCFNIGMNGYLAKPFSPNDLMKHLYNLIDPIHIKEKQMEQEQMSAEKLYDLSYLHQLEDNEYLIEMIELFFETTSEMLEEIRENIKKKDWDAVSKACHKLKSSLGPLQISKMTAIASTMEENSKQGKNLEEIVYLNKELLNQYNIVKPLIASELAKAKKISNGFVAPAVI
ncbi:PAS domain S-box protein [Segetibacter koreensis]|uniref:PAS domain S-box protein n=1 Tax=Segetibacter koreensis TaxID=398037 RepID=UPI0003667431|nr:PAS domain S-box protein [Segetibacter koreensis]